MRVKNWDKFQHYKHRNPPWIRLYRDLLNDRQWMGLSGDASKLLACCWLIASEHDGELPSVPDLAWRLRMDEKSCARLISELNHWLIVDASDLLASCLQDATTETETETETEKEKETTAIAVAAGFQGKVVRLNAKDFASWQSAYCRLDLVAELTARDEYLAEQPPDVRRKWFQSTSKYLANRNMEARAKGELKAQPYKSRTQEAFDQLDEVIKHGTGGLGICEERGEAALLEFPKSSARSADIRGSIDEGARGPAQVLIASFGRSADGLPCDSEIPDDRGRE